MPKNHKKAPPEPDTDALEAITTTPDGESDDGDEASSGAYRVKLEMFEGPLDLLLHLIRKNEVDICDIPVASITEQYLDYIRTMENLDINVAGEFLVMAATLIYIKTKMLLPRPPKIEGMEEFDEDPRTELVERLLEHQKFKAAAQMLYSRGEVEAACFTRAPLETDKNNPEVSATVVDLLRVFRETLQRHKAVLEMEVKREEITVADKTRQIRQALAEHNQVSIRELFAAAQSKREMIVIFMVFLELVKLLEVRLVQQEPFGDIIAHRRSEEEIAELRRVNDAPDEPAAEVADDENAMMEAARTESGLTEEEFAEIAAENDALPPGFDAEVEQAEFDMFDDADEIPDFLTAESDEAVDKEFSSAEILPASDEFIHAEDESRVETADESLTPEIFSPEIVSDDTDPEHNADSADLAEQSVPTMV